MRKINLIVAVANNRAIGRSGHLPWNIPEDQQWFRGHIRGGLVLSGRTSYEEAGPLLRRICKATYVLTGNDNWQPDGESVFRAASLDQALAAAQVLPVEGAPEDEPPIWVCGGQRVYEEALEKADRLYLTRVDTEIADADTFFPPYESVFPNVVQARESSDANFHYTFEIREPAAARA